MENSDLIDLLSSGMWSGWALEGQGLEILMECAVLWCGMGLGLSAVDFRQREASSLLTHPVTVNVLWPLICLILIPVSLHVAKWTQK